MIVSHTSVSRIFEIPKLYYFEAGNDYSGSRDDFSFKIVNGEKLKCEIPSARQSRGESPEKRVTSPPRAKLPAEMFAPVKMQPRSADGVIRIAPRFAEEL